MGIGFRFRATIADWIRPSPEAVVSRASRGFSAIVEALAGQSDNLGTTLQKLISAYGEEVWVYISIAKNAQTCASVPMVVERTGTGDRGERVSEGPLVDLLKRPNDWMSGSDFIEHHQSSMGLCGESFIELDRGPSGMGRTVGMYPLPLSDDDSMTVVRRPGLEGLDGPVDGYVYRFQGTVTPFLASEIIHVKYYNPFNPFRGLPPIRAGRRVVGGSLAKRTYNQAFFENDASPRGHYEADGGTVTNEQYKRLVAMIEARHKGAKKAHRPLLLRGIKWVSSQMSPKETEFLAGMKIDRLEMIALFGVRPVVVGLLEDNPQANADIQWRDYWQTTIKGEHRKLAEKLNAELAPQFNGGGLQIEFDYSGVAALQQDFGAKIDMGYKLWQMSVPLNAINHRLNLGFEEFPWGDIPLVNPLLVPIDQLGQLTPAAKSILLSAHAFRELQGRIELTSPPIPLQLADRTIETRKVDALERFAAAQDRQTDRAIPKIKEFFREQGRRTIRNLDEKGAVMRTVPGDPPVAAADLSIIFDMKAEADLMQPVNREILRKAMLEAMLSFCAQHGISEDKLNFVSDDVIKFLQDESGRHAKNITDTTRESLRVELEAALKEGESIAQIAKRIEAVFEDRASTAETIARTETGAALNFGNHESAKQSGAGSKTWVSSRDIRVRHDHASIDRHTTEHPLLISAPYQLADGSRMMHPLDSSLGASASQICNCRCTEIYHFS